MLKDPEQNGHRRPVTCSVQARSPQSSHHGSSKHFFVRDVRTCAHVWTTRCISNQPDSTDHGNRHKRYNRKRPQPASIHGTRPLVRPHFVFHSTISPASLSKAKRTDGEEHKSSNQAKKRKALWTRVKFHADSNSVKTRHLSSGILPWSELQVWKRMCTW